MNDSRLAVALTKCFYCLGGGAIIMNSRLTEGVAKKVDELDGMVVDMEPCGQCKEWMKQGVILISIDSAKSDPGWNKPSGDQYIPNPWRAGGFAVVKDEAVRRMVNNQEMADWAIQHRWMFIEHAAGVAMGLFGESEAEGEASGS